MSATLSSEAIGREAVTIANELQEVLVGRNTVATYLALGMVMGVAESWAERPNLDGMMKTLRKVAEQELQRNLLQRRSG